MCKSSSHALPTTTAPSSSHRRRSPSTGTGTASSSSAATATTSSGPRTTTATTTGTGTASSSSHSSRSSLAAEGARASLPYQPVLYSFHELAAATNNFLAKRNPSDATFWRCSLRSRHAALFQLRPLPQLTPAAASAALARVARYHHASLARLLGACPAGAHVYLAYELPTSACTLAACLSSSSSSRAGGGSSSSTSTTNTVLPTWLSRVQVAVDVAQGIEYAHAHADAAHGRVSPSSVLLVPDAGSSKGVRGVLTHFGAAHFADAQATEQPPSKAKGGKAGDVRAFGVLLLGLLAGEPAESRYRFDRGTKELARVSVVDTAAEAVRTGRVRSWLDRRLGDSFPVAAAERLVEVGLRCAAGDDEEEERPEMAWVAGKVSRVYVESRAWERTLQPHSDDLSSVALAPR